MTALRLPIVCSLLFVAAGAFRREDSPGQTSVKLWWSLTAYSCKAHYLVVDLPHTR